MPAWPPRLGYARGVDIMRLNALPDWKLVTASATPHEVGAYQELLASTSGEAQFAHLWVRATQSTGTDTPMLLNLAIGGAGVEKKILSNVGIGNIQSWASAATPVSCRLFQFPLYIPAGTRVAAQIQSAAANDTADVAIDLYGGVPPGGFGGSAGIDTYGASTTTSRGVALTTSAVANNEGLWTEIIASTPNPIRALMISPQGNNGVMSNASFVLDIGAGALTAEKEVVQNIPIITGSNEIVSVMDPGTYPLDTPIPAGSRIVARVLSATINNSDLSLIVHGIRG